MSRQRTLDRLRRLEHGASDTVTIGIEAARHETDAEAIERVFGSKVPAGIEVVVIAKPLTEAEWTEAYVEMARHRANGGHPQEDDEILNRSSLLLGPAIQRVIAYGGTYP